LAVSSAGCFTVDDPVVVLVGIHSPGKCQLLEIAKTNRPPALFSGTIQGREQYCHQNGDNGNDYKKLY
jgi:hypothetical protein